MSTQEFELMKKVYCGESIIDLPEDVGYMLDESHNPKASKVPQDEHGLHRGSFVVTVLWRPE